MQDASATMSPVSRDNTDLEESKTMSNTVVVIVLFSLSAIFVGLRLFTRLNYQGKKLGLDDHFMNAGLVSVSSHRMKTVYCSLTSDFRFSMRQTSRAV